MFEQLIIPLNGLKSGRNSFSWKVGKEFLEEFGNTEILNAEVDVEITTEKSGSYFGVDCSLEGKLTVACDRCLAELELPVSELVKLSVKFGEEPTEGTTDLTDDEREIVWLSDEEENLDMSQTVYDFICLSVPIHKVHEDGDCDPEVLKYICGESEDATSSEEVPMDSPFAGLADMLEKKNGKLE